MLIDKNNKFEHNLDIYLNIFFIIYILQLTYKLLLNIDFYIFTKVVYCCKLYSVVLY